ncbi:hypothetical protein FKM82_014881 [Ascaphus truei]
MLKSTEFFRGIECPFGEQGPAGGERCRRPYCHFRHGGGGSGGRAGGKGRAAGSSGTGGGGEALSGAEYDLYSPDFSTTPPCLDDGVLGDVPEPSLGILELERVNKAIEAAKSEVEREQRKYEELLEMQKEYDVSLSASAVCNSFSSLEYDPGSYRRSGSTDYNPTPLAQPVKGSCKYTLDDSDGGKHKSRSMEYVPAVVTPAPKYKTKHKYVIDNSKPHTDMEYDPMSNYSARLLNKVKEQRGTKRSRSASQEEGYTPSVKKICSAVLMPMVYPRFSDSEQETESEYHPTPCKRIPSKASEGVSSTKKCTKTQNKVKSSQKVKEIAVQYDMGDITKPKISQCKEAKKKPLKSAGSKSEKGKEESRARSTNTDSKKRTVLKEEMKKEKPKTPMKTKLEITEVRNGERKEGGKSKPKTDTGKSERVKFEKQNSKREKGCIKTTPSSSCRSKNVGTMIKSSTEKAGMVKKDNKSKAGEVRNGKCKDKDTKSEPTKKSRSPASSRTKEKSKRKQRSLSHVDLFGDESSEELEDRRRGASLSSDGGGHSDTEGESRMYHCKVTSHRPSTSSVDSLEMDYSVLEKDLDSDSDPMEECLRVFNESHDVKTEDKGRIRKQHHEGSEESSDNALATLVPGQKRRISHVTNPTNLDSPSKPVIRPYRRPTPQQICYQRIQHSQEQASQLIAQQQVAQKASAIAQKALPSLSGKKRRIAHFPGLLSSSPRQPLSPDVKKPIVKTSLGTTPMSNGLASTLKARTLTGMASKTTTTAVQRRQAHVPSLQSASLKRPVLPTEFGAKVPTNVRQRYLNLFIDECLKFCASQQDAFDKALAEEKVVYDRSTSRNIYLNVAVNTLKKLRGHVPSSAAASTKSVNKKTVSHESVLGGKRAVTTSFSLQRCSTIREEELTDAVLYTKLKDYFLTMEQLQENGYPLPHPDKPGRALVFTAGEEKKTSDSFCRVCCRCGAEYFVSPSGNCVRREECVHHWGRLRRQRVPGGWETHYNCCSGAVGSSGCQVGKQHVQDGRKENLDGYVKTFEKMPQADGNSGVYALDCEMCYTTHGLELTRVTVINSQLKVVYDTFVKPDNRIVDYNTRFSGVTEEDLQNTSITLRDVQAVLLCMFNADTILIGHSLESDLFALKIIHLTVVDTAIVFPHRLGMPYKRALRTLMADYLQRIIQDNVEGHDSSEDACSCMELMMWRLKEDAKVKR